MLLNILLHSRISCSKRWMTVNGIEDSTPTISSTLVLLRHLDKLETERTAKDCDQCVSTSSILDYLTGLNKWYTELLVFNILDTS